MLRNYTRWRQGATPTRLHADILGSPVPIEVDTASAQVILAGRELTPDEARMIGVRLIDAAVLADGDRAIRRPADTLTP
ncbi:hypothetical protein CSH63_22045 [Micromonospora tulbaghiae]|uniref:Uncharacterized protein n=1 Tax=Micromonospora tulbaghiae TaxID=479978 RepID=A0A386WRQ2_9ACTN|nr:hypothetical protein [Micromonospora tulbaghiae]AYF30080.1 hypothetical protein CSH63_22045 [Micromonospora tulbaghiae]NED51625.1 hypothetical protein [Micromonospora aurantiaca]